MITVEKLEKGTYFDDAFKISFRYDPTTVAKVKELAERRYLPEDRAWEIPAHELPALIEKVGLSNIKSEEAVVQALNTKEIEDKREATQERLKGIKPVRDFDFKTAPLPHQIEAFNYGMEKNSLLIGDEQGLGKTKQTKGRRTRKRDSTMGKAGEINPLGCDNENISYNSLMEIMGVVSERLQANTDTIKHDMINWLTKLRKQLLEANGGHTEADLQRELSRKSKLLDAYLDGILNKQEYQKKAEELDERIIQLKAETEKNKANSGDIAEIDKVLANIDEEVSRYVDGNEKLKVEYLLEHLEQVQIFPDKVIVIVPILSEGIVVEKTQYVSREKRGRKIHDDEHHYRLHWRFFW